MLLPENRLSKKPPTESLPRLSPLLPDGRSGDGGNLAGQFCYKVLAGRDEICRPGCPVQPVLATGRAQVVERQIVLKDSRVL